MQMKTVSVVHFQFQNSTTGDVMDAFFNADDGALAGYDGPGPGWVLVGQETIQQQQPDYTDYNTYEQTFGTPAATAAVAAGAVTPPSGGVHTTPATTGAGNGGVFGPPVLAPPTTGNNLALWIGAAAALYWLLK